MRMMQDPIQDRICNHWIIEYIIPRVKVYVGCQNSAPLFIAQINQLKEEFCIYLCIQVNTEQNHPCFLKLDYIL